jgi:hypothetical protein
MSRYIMIRRLRGPAFLLLVGVIALLSQAHILSWGKSWPLYLILLGVLMLAERAALASEGGYPGGPPDPYPHSGVDPNAPMGNPQYPAQQPKAIVPLHSTEFDKNSDPNGGQS